MVSPVWLWQADQGAIEELQKLSIGSLRKLGLRMKKSRFQLHLLIYKWMIALRTLVTFWNCSIILICKFLVPAYTDSLLILIFHSTLIDASGSRNQSHSTTILSKMWTYLSKTHFFLVWIMLLISTCTCECNFPSLNPYFHSLYSASMSIFLLD